MPLSRFAYRPFKWMKHRYAGHPFRVAAATLKATLLCHLVMEYGFTTVITLGPSMLPTLEVLGDWVIISKSFRRGRGIVVGDVISFDSVIEPGERVIKRVIGVQGDFVLRNTPGTENSEMIQVR